LAYPNINVLAKAKPCRQHNDEVMIEIFSGTR